ncbi:hypothetical protein QB607_004152 [Clostridium botulinum]|nr:hypothetical protein [Clostridium botulinum]EKS4397158.1 hypothetical protein [Clostridium botulinum]
MDIKVKEDVLQEYIKCAYKKLKSYSYHENKNMFLKNRIVDFENHGIKAEISDELIYSIEDKFKTLREAIEGKEKIKLKFVSSSKLKKDSLKEQGEFTIRSVPKSIIDDKCGGKIIRNFVEKDSNAKVDKIMHYLDIDIMSQIIGTMWVMIIGKEIEETYKDYTAGNILEDDISKKNLKLFKPYYLSYERWRDDAINIVEDRISKGNRSTMLSLDIKEYYYSINLDIKNDKEKIMKIFKNRKNKQNISLENFKYINDYVFDVIEAYSKVMELNRLSDNNQNKIVRNIMPIGFLPSSILSNWYLHEFDESVNSKINPLYYKRYVDDILIVLNTDYNKQKVFCEEEILNNKFYDAELFEIGILIDKKYDNDKKENTEVIVLSDVDKFIEFTEKIDRMDTKLKKSILDIVEDIINSDKQKKYFNTEDVFSDWKINNPIKNKCELEEVKKKFKKKLKYINKKLKIESPRIKKIYLIKSYINKDSYLIIQDEKVRVYDFISNGSKALIENFKKEIVKNSSAFRFLPQKDEVLNSFDSEVYKVEYKDSIHKLSSIEDLKINRYNLSKFLARIIYSDKLENDNYTKDVDEKILWIFKGGYAIEYFFLWDKVFNYYLINKRYDLIKDLFINIYTAIDKLELQLADFSIANVNFKINGKDNKETNLKVSLKSYLKFVLSMNYALDDGVFINDIKISNKNNKSSRNKYKEYDTDIKSKFEGKLKYENKININKTDIMLDGIYGLKEKIRISNMLNHSFVKSPLMNYYYLGYKNCYIGQFNLINVNFITSIVGQPEILTDRSRCFLINSNYKDCIKNESCSISEKCKNSGCNIKKESYSFAIEYSPRFVHLHECILNSINNIIAEGNVISKGKEIKEGKNLFYKLNKIEKGKYNINMYPNINNTLKNESCEESKKVLLNTHFKYFDVDDYLFTQKERVINYLECGKKEKKDSLKIGIVNMKVYDEDLLNSFKKTPNIGSRRLEKISKLLNIAVKTGAEVIVFPEVSVPIEWLGVISDFARKHDVLIICGLEHIIYDNRLCCNYIATILPDKYEDYTYSVVKLRLKNHYSPKEKEWVKGYGWQLPIENNKEGRWKKEYDLFRWKGIDFSTFSCFELANIQDRGLFTSFVDLLVGSVHNRDTNYYSNIMESLARDVHCYVVHVNDSNLGDNRIIKPAATNEKNILQVSGGINDVVLVGEIDIKALRDFQIKNHNLQIYDNRFKAAPPEYKCNNVKIRDNLPL